MSVVDWERKEEPWRSVGLGFVQDIESGCAAVPRPPSFAERADKARRDRGLSVREVERGLGWPHTTWRHGTLWAFRPEREQQLAEFLEIKVSVP